MENTVLEINAAFYSLINQTDIEESAQIIIEYAQRLPKGGISLEISGTKTETESFTGQTDLGNVQMTDEKKTHWQKTFGAQKDRIGHFKVWRDKLGDVHFQHFWKAEEETAGNDPKSLEYSIEYNKKNLKFIRFGYIDEWIIFSIFGIKLISPIFYELKEKTE